MARPPQIELRRHYHQMSEKDADAVVEAVADLIVCYLKRHPGSLPQGDSMAATHHSNHPAPTAVQAKEIQE